MYDYEARQFAPKAVEFFVRTIQGHRVVRIYLDLPTPRIIAFNESSSDRDPAVLWLTEIHLLLARAKEICDMD